MYISVCKVSSHNTSHEYHILFFTKYTSDINLSISNLQKMQ